jgi:hypothetical protein
MYSNFEQSYHALSRSGFVPVSFSDSAVCCAVLSVNIASQQDEILGAATSFDDLENRRASGAIVFTTSLNSDKMFGFRQGGMPLHVIRTKIGVFFASDVSIVTELEEQEVEVYCIRNGGLAEVNKGQFLFKNLYDEQRPAHYGRMMLSRSRLDGVEMQPCGATRGWANNEEKWDLRSTTRWAIWPEEDLCLHCAAERAELIRGPLTDGSRI